MRIKPEPPFDNWDRAYLLKHVASGPAKNRKFVHLFNSKTDRKCISYARYLMCVKLGRILDPSETVDHVNNDPTDDRIENLQILSLADNIRKCTALKMQSRHNKRTCKCPECVQHRRMIRNASAKRRPKSPEALERIRESHRRSYLKHRRSRSAMDSTAAP